MNSKTITILVICVILVAVAVTITKNKEGTQQQASVSQTLEQKANSLSAQAKKVSDQAQAEAQKLAQQATQEAQEQQAKLAEKAEADAAAQAAEGLAAKIRELIAKAKTYLEDGNYKEAIKSAQQALTSDPNSTEAKGIVEKAKEGLQRLAQEKIDAAKEMDAASALDSVQGALGGIGQ